MKFSIEKSDLDLVDFKLRDLLSNLENKSFLISGASGFFGRCLLESLLYLNEKNHLNIKIYAVSRDVDNFGKKFSLLKNSLIIDVIESDISGLKNFDKKVDHIIHAACDTSPDKLKNFSKKFIEENYLGTVNMLEIARLNHGCNFLYLSSGAVYGSQNSDIKLRLESDISSPDLQKISSAYGEVKRLGEMLCTVYNATYGVQTKIARCFSFVGPYMNFDGHYAIGNFIRDVAAGKNIFLKSKNKVFRSYLYSVDLVIWLIRILFLAPQNSVYNAGSDQEISVQDLAELVKNTLNKNCEIIFSDGEIVNTSSSLRYVPSIAKAKAELGLRQFTSLPQAIQKTYNWYKK